MLTATLRASRGPLRRALSDKPAGPSLQELLKGVPDLLRPAPIVRGQGLPEAAAAEEGAAAEACGTDQLIEEELEELEEMIVMGPAGKEWNGPTRGGRMPEPTRFGDWERKGRASDF